ncbi:MAG TPA: DUF4238 domain-containing protein [Acidimicrobiales bacterium]|nr:DUF4238 domain-containing protein [Acidimicrobiales bacterium]
MPERSKRHHFLPQLIQRSFAKDSQVMTFDREKRASYPQSITTAAAENDYNSLLLEDGTLSDAAEKAISSIIEGPVGKVLQRIDTGGWVESKTELFALARFIVFQFLRVPSNREQMDALADQTMKLDMAAGGPAKLREVLDQAFGRPATDEEVWEHWEAIRDFDDWSLVLPREHHVQESLQMLDEFTPALATGYRWSVMRWKRRHLLTSDNPVVLVPPDGSTEPAGLYTAGMIFMSISRSTAIVLTNGAVSDELPEGPAVAGTFAMARRFNGMTAAMGRRWIYHHPDDSLDDLLGEGWELPVIPPISMDDDHSRELRRRLALMAEWAFHHPDQPHPMFGDVEWDWDRDVPGPRTDTTEPAQEPPEGPRA